jgi:hypothetical protein
MTRSEKIFGFMLVAVVGAWGCSKTPESALSGKSTSLEAKVQRLEEDFHAAASARDQYKQRLLATEDKLTAAETHSTQLQAQFDDTRAQRDALKNDLQMRTLERDNFAMQYETFRKNLKNLIGQAENALGTPIVPPPPVSGGSPPQPSESGSTLRN